MPSVGRVDHDQTTATNLYIDHLVATIAPLNDDKTQPKPLKGLKIVADCANGATSVVAPEALRRAGADVIVINASPDGYQHQRQLPAPPTPPSCSSACSRKAADAVTGVAFDGDADRFLAVDEKGRTVDGDRLMAIYALAMKEEGRLAENKLVVTVMSNLGLKLAMRDAQIDLVETGVGDRYVNEGMQKTGAVIGGEQSGHIIFREYNSTGDGTLTSADPAATRSSSPASACRFPSSPTRPSRSLPQALVNACATSTAGQDVAAIRRQAHAAAREEAQLGETPAACSLRPSGTEPLVRVMAEAATQAYADEVCTRLAKIVAEELAL